MIFSFTANRTVLTFMRQQQTKRTDNSSNKEVLAFLLGIMGVILATVVVFVLSILCGMSPIKNIIHSVMACIYFSTVAFAPLIHGCCIWLMNDKIPGQRETHTLKFAKQVLAKVAEVLEPDAADLESLLHHRSNDEGEDVTGVDLVSTTAAGIDSSVLQTMSEYGYPRRVDGSVLHHVHANVDLLQEMRACYLPGMYGSLLGVSIFSILTILDWGAQCQRWPVPMLLGTTGGYTCGVLAGIFIRLWQRIRIGARHRNDSKVE